MSTTRTVTAFSTRGKKKSKITTDVTTWGSLKPLLENEGFSLETLAATESINRTDLAHVDAVLPEGDFTIFLRPTKTKSGADYKSMSYRELKSLLNDEDKTALAEITGKNWTRCSTDDMREYFVNKTDSSFDGNESSAVAPNTESIGELVEITNLQRLSQINSLISEIKDNSSSSDVIDRVDVVIEELEGLQTEIENEASPEAAAERKAEEERIAAEKAELEALEQEATALKGGY